jgi:6-phosphogluconolactonase
VFEDSLKRGISNKTAAISRWNQVFKHVLRREKKCAFRAGCWLLTHENTERFQTHSGKRVITMNTNARLYFGTYNFNRSSEGIYVYETDSDTGQLRFLSACGECENPSYLAIANNRLYTADELPHQGRISAYCIDPATGGLTYLNSAETPGAGLCHISAWPKGRWISGANYMGGNFVTCALTPDGSMGEPVQSIPGGGGGPDQLRQDGPHAHSITPSPDGMTFVGADLGSDRLYVFRANITTGQLEPAGQQWVLTRPGEGPRHFAFHPGGRVGYLLTEMGCGIYVYAFDPPSGRFELIQSESILPEGWTAPNLAAAIKVSQDGRYVYASNRGADCVAAFKTNPADGTLGKPAFYPSHGQAPRDFTISPDGRLAVITNQMSGSVFTVRRDPESGEFLEALDQTAIPNVVCVLWAPI